MAPASDVELVLSFLEGMIADPGPATARRYLAADATVVANGRELTGEAFAASVPESRPYEFVDHDHERVVVEDDWVAVWTRGTCELVGPMFGVEGVDEPIELTEVVFCRVVDGAIRRAHILTDNAAFYEQLGLLSEDPRNERVRDQYYAILGRVLRHDLRNRLGVVRAEAESLLEGGDPAATGDRIRETVDDLMATAEKARGLQQRAVDVDIDPEPVDLGALLDPLVAAYDDRHGGAVRTAYPAGRPPTVTTGRALLETAVRELLENAVEHTDGADVTVAARPADGDDRATSVTVTDDGPGINEEELAPLRAGEETALLHGSGIGLWVVRWGVTRLHGTVTFEEPSGGGTRVRLRLPDME